MQQEDKAFHEQQLATAGFTVIDNIFPDADISAIATEIAATVNAGPAFRKTKDLFAIRRFLREIPSLRKRIFTEKLNDIVHSLFGTDYFVVKSIYFDKPAQSNWFVAWHQDLTISVDKKVPLQGFGPWTAKDEQFAVQPPLEILKNIFTIRIHLDDTDENNGALKVVPGSHLKGVYRPETIDWKKESMLTCKVKKGGVMIMRPLLLHASDRAAGNKNRRVIHIEFANTALPRELQWAESLHPAL
ncbi:phytanoyl-CoA dioxygenase family protein [uncultured Chitinophaga sp.]|jgi:Protein involved in biosynthesis of mitomycin antibiotics/polyketide fumonisin|uniref:phytanoyl-CoA dioxygenase family protein n=1 Tax=uncultured Chitinophaga sp. TaxID=339340 RepID=UPI00260DD1F0|nr:phytanoyl-CoA dioxygenase family protein [uncultured Chitinophaga sp.]